MDNGIAIIDDLEKIKSEIKFMRLTMSGNTYLVLDEEAIMGCVLLLSKWGDDIDRLILNFK